MKYKQETQKALEEKLEQCKKIDIKTVNADEVEDIENIKINKDKSSAERILDFLNTCKNPYLFKTNGIVVQIGFSDNNINANECISRALKNEFIK